MDKRSGLVLGLMVAACLSGCGAIKAERKEHEGEADLARISRWLPGAYDNAAQVKSDLSKGVTPAHDAVELNIVAVDSIAVGRSAFYMQETAADDPMRVFSQRVITFSVTKKGIVQTVNTLVDPLRWRNGYREPDIFEGMTPRDFKPATGCEITWAREEKPVDPKAQKLSKDDAAREAEHAKYIGTDDSKHCEMNVTRRHGPGQHGATRRTHRQPDRPRRNSVRHRRQTHPRQHRRPLLPLPPRR